MGADPCCEPPNAVKVFGIVISGGILSALYKHVFLNSFLQLSCCFSYDKLNQYYKDLNQI